MRPAFVLVAFLVACSLFSSSAGAQRSRAARLFAEGARHAASGRHHEAAQAYEGAYAIAPANLALIRAAEEWIEAGEWDHVLDVVQRLEDERDDPEVFEYLPLAYQAMRRARAHVVIRCATPCRVGVDGAASEPIGALERSVWLVPGEHVLGVVFAEGAFVERVVRAAPGESTVELAPPIPPASVALSVTPPAIPEPVERDEVARSGVSRGVRAMSFTLLATAVAIDSVALVSSVASVRSRRRYASDPTPESWAESVDTQRRTNLFTGIGVTVSVAATASIVTMIGRRSRVVPAVAVAPGAAQASIRTEF